VHLGRIEVFPIKSLDALSLPAARITARGILEHDRIYTIVDAEGRFVNGKRTPRVHQLRAEFDATASHVRLRENGGAPAEFSRADPEPITHWLSVFFGYPVRLERDAEKGFPDDEVAFGPTLTSEASLQAVQGWFPHLTLEGIRRRFRSNLELIGDAPFCEDRLSGAAGELKPFQIGAVHFRGHNPCQRCAVPTRDAETGEVEPGFQKRFTQMRQAQLPPWSTPERFNHFYRFAVNTSIATTEAGKILRVGDPVRTGE